MKYDSESVMGLGLHLPLEGLVARAEKYSNRQGDPQLGVELVLEWAHTGRAVWSVRFTEAPSGRKRVRELNEGKEVEGSSTEEM